MKNAFQNHTQASESSHVDRSNFRQAFPGVARRVFRKTYQEEYAKLPEFRKPISSTSWSPKNEIKNQYEDFEIDFLNIAYSLAFEAHGRRTRRSGELYANHSVSAAKILLQEFSGTNLVEVVAELLHDVIEEESPTWTLYWIREHLNMFLRSLRREGQYGAAKYFDSIIVQVLRAIDIVSKLPLERVKIHPLTEVKTRVQDAFTRIRILPGEPNKRVIALMQERDAIYDESLSRLAKVPNLHYILRVKFADRLHNIRTSYSDKPNKQREIIEHTLQVIIPLARKVDYEIAELLLKETMLLKEHVESKQKESPLPLKKSAQAARERLGAMINTTLSGESNPAYAQSRLPEPRVAPSFVVTPASQQGMVRKKTSVGRSGYKHATV